MGIDAVFRQSIQDGFNVTAGNCEYMGYVFFFLQIFRHQVAAGDGRS